MDRRDFIQKSIILTCGIAGASAFLEACKKSNPSTAPSVNFTIDISSSQYSALQKNGSYVYYSPSNIIIARDKNGNFVALYDVCTHAGCTIQFNANNSNFPCPCHGSIFDESGNVVNGPATSGLKKYSTTLTGNNLNVFG